MIGRIVGRYTGSKKGPLVVVFGAIHGNEPAGVEALKASFGILETMSKEDKAFVFSGRLLGLIGNLQAYMNGERFVERDLNRCWTTEQTSRILKMPASSLRAEDKEVWEIRTQIQREVLDYKPEVMILVDVHTTSAQGGVFCIPTNDMASLRLAKALNTPVILGMLDGIEGTLLHYIAANHMELGGYPRKVIGVAVESGQHRDPESVVRATSAIIHVLKATGSMVSSDTDRVLSPKLTNQDCDPPRVSRLRYVHRIRQGDGFSMRPGFLNFDPVEAGQPLADDITGPVLAPFSGLILMPLYQHQGADGFFIIQKME
jgi:succinylglutamate desuccinylase